MVVDNQLVLKQVFRILAVRVVLVEVFDKLDDENYQDCLVLRP